MKRIFICLVATAALAGAAMAHAATASELELGAASLPSGQTSSDVLGDAGAILGRPAQSGDAGNGARDRNLDDADIYGDPAIPSRAAPRKSRAQSWQSLLPGSIQ